MESSQDTNNPVAWCHLSYNDDGSSIPDSLQHCPDSYCTTPLYTAPPKRQPLTDAQRYALIEKHLGLEQRKNATVIAHRTGRWTDAARYFDLMDAAIETANGTGEQT